MVVLSSKNLIMPLLAVLIVVGTSEISQAVGVDCKPNFNPLNTGDQDSCSDGAGPALETAEARRLLLEKTTAQAEEERLKAEQLETLCKRYPDASNCGAAATLNGVEDATDLDRSGPKKTATPSKTTAKVPTARPDVNAGVAQASACQSSAASAKNTCSAMGPIVSSAENEINAISSKMQNSNATPLASCQEISRSANSSISQLSSAKSNCQSAVSYCLSTCDAAVSAAPTGSPAATSAATGRGICASANLSGGNADSAIARLQSANSMANSCIAQATGSTSNDSTAQDATGKAGAGGDIGSALNSFGSGSSASGAPDYSSSSVSQIVNSKQSYSESSSGSVLQKSTGSSATDAAPMDLSRGRHGPAGSRGQGMNQQANSLTALGGGSAFAASKTKDDANRESMRANLQRSRFGNMEVNGGSLSGGGSAPRYGAGAHRFGSGQGAAAANAEHGMQVAKYDARRAQPELTAFLPTTKDVRVGGRKPASDRAREIVGPHENLFRNQSSAFKRIFED